MDNLNELKIMLTAAITAVMGLLGWQGMLLCPWMHRQSRPPYCTLYPAG